MSHNLSKFFVWRKLVKIWIFVVLELGAGFREQGSYSQIIELKNGNFPLWKDGKEATTQEEIGGFPT